MKKLKKIRRVKTNTNGFTGGDRYICLMGLVGISPECAKKDMTNTKEIKSECSWKGHCKRCGMIHIE